MLMAMNTIANGGMRMKPMIVKSIVDQDGTPVLQYEPQQVGQIIAPRTCMLMTTALRKVVGPDGTAPKAGVPGFDVAGKTGTAQKVENGQYVLRNAGFLFLFQERHHLAQLAPDLLDELVVFGFLQEVLDRVTLAEVRDGLERAIASELEQES